MENIIIGIVLIGIIAWAVRGSVKHFRGEGACCGGGSASKPAKKRLTGKKLKTYILSVEGMRCKNCAYTVERTINAIDGAAAKVNLQKREARVDCDREIDIDALIAEVCQKGYKATLK